MQHTKEVLISTGYNLEEALTSMQHTKEVLISTGYNLEEALTSTNQCPARLIVTFLVKPSLTSTGKQIPSSICLRTLQLNLEIIGACIL